MPTIPEFDTSAEVTGATLISETDEEIRQLMTDVKSYQESVSAILNNYTTEEIDSAIANLNADITLKLNELLSVNPDGTYYTKNAIDSKIDLATSGNYSAYGFTSPIKKEDLFEETVTANSIVIKASPSIRGFKGIIERNSDETVTLPFTPFDVSSNDNTYATGSTQTSRAYSTTDIIIQEGGDVIWQFLLDTPISTAFASLVQGTDYQVLDEVTRQDLIYWAEDKTTGSGQWKSVKGLKHYLAKDILNNDLIASDKGWTKVDNNLWEDSTDYITCLFVVPRINTGAFDFSTNFFGDKEYSDGTYKDSSFRDISTYNAFANKGTVNGRPDSKDSTKIYLDGENGLIYKPSSAKEIHENNLVQEWQRDCVSDLDGINSQNDNAYFTTQGTALVVEDLTDTAKVLWDLSSKSIEVKQVLYTTDNGTTWDTETFTLDSINNQITLGNARAEIKVSYQAQNQTLQQQDLIEILIVGNQVIASNSNNIYKGAMLGTSATGKIQVGNSTNGLESRNVENITYIEPFNYKEGNTYYVIADTTLFRAVESTGNFNKGDLFKYPINLYNWTAIPQSSLDGTWYKSINITTTPKHNSIILNNDNSSAFKGLPFVGVASNNELVVGMFTEEGKYNVSGYGWDTGVGLTFQQLANGLVDGVYENDLQTTILYKRTGRFKND